MTGDPESCDYRTAAIHGDECLRLLGTARLGRVVFHNGGGPVMQLASHAVIGGEIAFLTLAGGSLSRLIQAAGSDGATVKYEGDGVDAHGQIIWDVVVEGRAWASDEAELAVWAWDVLDPLIDRFRGQIIRVDAESVSGFEYLRHQIAPLMPGQSIRPAGEPTGL